MCNLDCLNCTYDDCINDGELDNAIACRSWYDRNKERKREYQRAYSKQKRLNKRLGINSPINISIDKYKPYNGEIQGCRRCKQKLPTKARGLCNKCYVYAYRNNLPASFACRRIK